MTALALPLIGLVVLLIRPELDVAWEHHPSHFWLILITALVSMTLAYVTNEAASRHADARLFLVSLAFLASAGFLGLHALATPGALLPEPNTGFVVATPIGLMLGAVLAAASVSPLAGPHGSVVLRHRALLRGALFGLIVAWGGASLLRLEPLRSAAPAETISGPITVLAVAGVGLYAYAAWRYMGIARRRSSPVAVALLAALVLLAEAMTAVAVSRAWRLSWWEWHLLMTAAFATIALAARAEYRRTGSLAAAFRPIYGAATLARIDRWHGQAMSEIVDLEARSEPIDRVVEDLRRDGASQDEIRLLTAAAQEVRRIDELFRSYLPRDEGGRVTSGTNEPAIGSERVASVLFADLAGFTSFSEVRQPTAVIGMLNTYWAEAVPIIDAAGGSIEHFAGDGVLATFGAGDHARHAATCALDLLAATEPIATANGWPRFRIGINTGAVVTGTVGADARRSVATIGDTTNVAARLMSVAAPGGIAVGGATRALLAEVPGIALEPLGPTHLKGKRESIDVWSLGAAPGSGDT